MTFVNDTDPAVKKIIAERAAEVRNEDRQAAQEKANRWAGERFNFALRILGFIQSTGVPKSLGIEALPYSFVIGITNIVNTTPNTGSKLVDLGITILKDAEKSLITVSNQIKEQERQEQARKNQHQNAKSNS